METNKGGGPKRTKGERKQDLVKIAAMYCEGRPQYEIVDWLTANRSYSVNQSTISRDLKTIRQQWLDSSVIDFNEAKARELAKVDHLEETYWLAWHRSLEPKTTGTARIVTDGKTENAQVLRDEAGSKEETRDGDPRFLAGVERCGEQRCKILGVYAAVKQEVKFPGGVPVQIEGFHNAVDAIWGEKKENEE